MTWIPSNMPVEVYDPYSVGQGLLYFVALPLAFIVIVSLIVSAPAWTRAGRHRPGSGWDSDPLWVGRGEQAPEVSDTSEHPAQISQDGGDEPSEPGGSSGRW